MGKPPEIETALLTGGNGNLGRLVADRLLAAGIRVVRFDLPGTGSGAARTGEEIVAGDIRDLDSIEGLLAQYRPDLVYHFASLLSGSSETDLETAWDVNASASFHLMRLAVKHRVGTLFFASTAATYGPDLDDPAPANSAQWPETMYGATKVAVERLGVYFKTRHGLDFRCLRFPLVISPFAPRSAVTAYPSHAFRAALAREPFTFPVSPEVGMSSIFLEDVIEGIVHFTLADRARLRRHAYNLHAYFVSAGMVADRIVERVPTFQYRYRPVPAVESLLAAWPDVFDDDAARQDWGWNPRFDFAKSADRMFDLLRT